MAEAPDLPIPTQSIYLIKNFYMLILLTFNMMIICILSHFKCSEKILVRF